MTSTEAMSNTPSHCTAEFSLIPASRTFPVPFQYLFDERWGSFLTEECGALYMYSVFNHPLNPLRWMDTIDSQQEISAFTRSRLSLLPTVALSQIPQLSLSTDALLLESS